jgi:predicted aspartyl protease
MSKLSSKEYSNINEFILLTRSQLVKKPVKSPVKKPVKKPVKSPVKKPIKKPVKKPVKKPIKSPVKKPIKKPIKSPVKKPIKKDKLSKILEKNYNKIPIHKSLNGFYTCFLKINDVKGLFLIDTGSNSTCIDKNKQKIFKIIVNNISEAFSVTNKMNISTSKKNNSIEIGKVLKNKIKLDLLDLTNVKNAVEDKKIPEISGILGNRILSSFNCLIDYEKNTLYVQK